jgi:AcrR family transcriptional regulator
MKKASEGGSHLPQRREVALNPRKLPVQARSAASVDAILQATIQVLLKAGKERLTTTTVALRAGVSVGTLYQYFPNKSALLQAVLRRHLNDVTETVERVCREQRANPLEQMATALIQSFLEVKMKDVRTSRALYSVSSDVDGARIVKQLGARTHRAMAEMFQSSCEPLQKDPQVMASLLQGAMNGVSRRILESDHPDEEFASLRQELVVFVCAYLRTCAVRSAA